MFRRHPLEPPNMKRRIAIVCAAIVILIAVAFILYSPSDSWLDGTWVAEDGRTTIIFNRNEFTAVHYVVEPIEPYAVFGTSNPPWFIHGDGAEIHTETVEDAPFPLTRIIMYGTFYEIDDTLALNFSHGDTQTLYFSTDYDAIIIHDIRFTRE